MSDAHFLVINYDEPAAVYGVFDTFEDAHHSITDCWAKYPSERAYHHPDVQEWRGDGYARHWRFEGDELVEIDFT